MSPSAAPTPAAKRAVIEAMSVTCAGCGAVAEPTVAFPARCRNATVGDDIDHLMTRRLDPTRIDLVAGDDPNPFVRYRQTFHAWHVARASGWSDERYVGVVHRLDRAIAAVDGHGFQITPFERADLLSDAIGCAPRGGVWIKDETRAVGGSHKARHLMGVMLELLVAEDLDASLEHRPLAIASCGNAALAAAIVAHAAGRRLDVYVPTDADPVILRRLERLHARVERVERKPGEPGDPTVARMHQAMAAGAWPLRRAYERIVADLARQSGPVVGPLDVGAPEVRAVLDHAARHRSAYMWPWESVPRSVAHGILDDETYDWLAVTEAMLRTGGHPVVVEEGDLVAANDLARRTTGIDVDATGSAGLAGLLHLQYLGAIARDERVAVLFTGARRDPSTDATDPTGPAAAIPTDRSAR